MAEIATLDLRLPSASAHWESPAFREELAAWVTAEVGEPTSLEPVKVRAWASVWRAETASGVHFAKQNCSTQAFEAALLAELVELAPHHVVPLTAVDLDPWPPRASPRSHPRTWWLTSSSASTGSRSCPRATRARCRPWTGPRCGRTFPSSRPGSSRSPRWGCRRRWSTTTSTATTSSTAVVTCGSSTSATRS